jgi:hypothetical protein
VVLKPAVSNKRRKINMKRKLSYDRKLRLWKLSWQESEDSELGYVEYFETEADAITEFNKLEL